MQKGLFALVLAAGSVALAAAPAGRLEVQGEAVRDRQTGLLWQRAPDETLRTWEEAKAFCEGARINFQPGWRLPSVPELMSIADVRASEPAIDADAFPSTPSAEFWTSTPYAKTEGTYWRVHFGAGQPNGAPGTEKFRVRCVR